MPAGYLKPSHLQASALKTLHCSAWLIESLRLTHLQTPHRLRNMCAVEGIFDQSHFCQYTVINKKDFEIKLQKYFSYFK